MHVLDVLMKVPLDPPMIFSHWLPIDKSDWIIREVDDMKVRLGFEVQSTWWASQPTREEISRWRNVMAHYALVSVQLQNVSGELATYMRENESSEVVEDDARAKQLEELGWRIISEGVGLLNALMGHVRALRGQYWLQYQPLERGQMMSDYARYETRATLDGKAVLWRPTHVHRMTVTMEGDGRYVRPDDWEDVGKSAKVKASPPLVGELLANAERLLDRGMTRSAITEGVGALEVALRRWSQQAGVQEHWDRRFAGRLRVRSLGSHVDHLGLGATLHYLLPLLFTEDEVPVRVLRTCQDAVGVRNNVVHQGQRKVSQESAQGYLRGLRYLCEVLDPSIRAVLSGQEGS